MSLTGRTVSVEWHRDDTPLTVVQTVAVSDGVEIADLSAVPDVSPSRTPLPASVDIADSTVTFTVLPSAGSAEFDHFDAAAGEVLHIALAAGTPRILNVAVDAGSNPQVGVRALSFGNDYVELDFDDLQYTPGFTAKVNITFDTAGSGRPSYGDMDENDIDRPHYIGTNGNDTFILPTDDRSVDLGAGVDILRVQGVASDYRVALAGSGNVLAGRLNADRDYTADNNDDLFDFDPSFVANVERVVFDNGTLAVDIGQNSHAGTAYRAYAAAFDRVPETAGLAFHIANLDGGQRYEDMAAGFVNSAEFQARFGASTSNAQFVDALYQNALGRAGDAQGVAYWNGLLDSGQSTRAQVLLGFTDSPENIVKTAGQIEHGIWLA